MLKVANAVYTKYGADIQNDVTSIPHGTYVNYTCLDKFKSSNGAQNATCESGQWVPEVPVCDSKNLAFLNMRLDSLITC